MKKDFLKIFIILTLLVFCFDAKAQVMKTTEEDINAKSWQFGGLIGISQYYGDISDKNFFQKISGESRTSGGLFARLIFNEKIGIGLSFNVLRLYSEKYNDATDREKQLAMSSNTIQIGPHVYFHFSNIFFGQKKRLVDVYGTLGIQYASWRSTLRNYYTGTYLYDDDNFGDSGFDTKGAVIPASLGVAFNVANGVKIHLEQSLQLVLSDDIDLYADGFKNDILATTQVGVSYTLGSGSAKSKKKSSYEEEIVKVVEYKPIVPKNSEEKLKIETAETAVPPVVVDKNAVEFRVQVLALNKSTSNVKSYLPHVSFDYPIVENQANGLYRYSTGSFSTFSQAEIYAQKMRSQGIRDAFVVAYRNNQRISITPDMKK